jgi:hypothetical protein
MSVDRQTSAKVIVERAVRRMNPDLRRQYDAIRRLLANVTAADARGRHRVGQIVVEIRRSNERYGARAVPLLAEALARDESTLYRYASVAEAWDEAALESVLDRRMPGREPLSWSHLLELAAIPSPERRERLLNEVLQRGLSVRALADLARGKEAEPAQSFPLPFARLRRLVAACASLDRFAIDDAFLERVIATAPAEAAAIVASARTAQVQTMRHLEENLAKLSKVEAELRQRPRGAAPRAVQTKATQVNGRIFPRLLVGATA